MSDELFSKFKMKGEVPEEVMDRLQGLKGPRLFPIVEMTDAKKGVVGHFYFVRDLQKIKKVQNDAHSSLFIEFILSRLFGKKKK